MINNLGADFESVPLFNMQQFLRGETKERNEFLSRLRDVCHHIGFFYIENHGISDSLMKQMLTLTKAFFDLSQEEKDTISLSPAAHYRGYGRLEAEKTKGIPDYKETYDLGLEQPKRTVSNEQPYLILQGPNQWPQSSKLSELRLKETVLQYITAMQSVGEHIMAAMSLALGVSENYLVNQFCSKSEDSYAILRLLRYPPGRLSEDGQEPQLGVGPHTDMGCLVILLQDDVGGLQIQNCNGKWVDAPPIPGTFVVNIGEMLQIWSNNYFLATPHRVINVSPQIRHSVPFFFEPNLSTVVSPLPLPPELMGQARRVPIDPGTRIVYGEHILNVYQRSFP